MSREIIEFDVLVSPKSIEIWEAEAPLKLINAQAFVDGVYYQYRISIKKPNVAKDVGKGWFGRAMNQVHYHAKNAGENVEFIPVSNKWAKKRKEVTSIQISFFPDKS